MTAPTTLHSPPTTDLYRMHTRAEDLALEDFRHLSGYAAVWDTPTHIANWEGDFTESIRSGAFRNTLAQRGDRVKLLYDHGFDPTIGNKPLGKITELREDDHGLYLVADLLDRPYAQDIAAAVGAGAIDGMSFRMSVVRDEWNGDARTINEVKLHEVSVVTFPAYEATKVGVRGAQAYNLIQDRLACNAAPAGETPGDSAHLSDERKATLRLVRDFQPER